MREDAPGLRAVNVRRLEQVRGQRDEERKDPGCRQAEVNSVNEMGCSWDGNGNAAINYELQIPRFNSFKETAMC